MIPPITRKERNPMTYARQCLKCDTFRQEIVRRLPNGNIILHCPKCGREETVTLTGFTVPGSVKPGREMVR